MSVAGGRAQASLRVAVVTERRLDGPVLDLLAFLSGLHDVTVHSGMEFRDPGHPARHEGGRLRMRPLPALSAATGPDPEGSFPGTGEPFGEPDVTVLLEDMSAAAFLAGVDRERRGGRLFLLAHQENHFPRITPLNEWSCSVRRLVHRSADGIAAVTRRAGDVLLVEGAPGGRIAVLSPGVETDRFAPAPGRRAEARARLGLRPGEKAVVFIGAMTWEDGIFDLLHAAKLLCLRRGAEDEGVRYVLYGEGSEAGRVRDTIEAIGMASRIRIAADAAGPEAPEIYNGADVLVAPSIVPRPWTEKIGGSVMEAMASGTAIVAADSGAMREVVADSGILVPPADPRALAGALEILLRDDEIRDGLGARARRRAVDRFDVRRAAVGLGDALRRLAPC